jgi:hypothetical protein
VVEAVELEGFGRFGKGSSSGGGSAAAPNPLFLGEPADENTMHTFAQDYLRSSGKRRLPAGFLFATNTDPVMTELYLSPLTHRAWHGEVTEWPVRGHRVAVELGVRAVEHTAAGRPDGPHVAFLPSTRRLLLVAPSTSGDWV